MKHFELVKEYTYPSGSVYVLYNKEKNFYIETTSMQDVNTRGKSQEIIMTDDVDLIKKNLVPFEEKVADCNQYTVWMPTALSILFSSRIRVPW